MIQGIVAQAVWAPANAEEPQKGVKQIIYIPASGEVWERELTEAHPKKVWRPQPAFRFSLSNIFGSRRIEEAFDTTWVIRAQADWHLTGRPMGFHITDEEFLELKRGEMPRNVNLRAQRALATRLQIVIGKEAARKPVEFRGMPIPRLDALPQETVGERLEAFLGYFALAVKEDNTAVLSMLTPKAATAKGAGKHRNADNLPVEGEGAEKEAPVEGGTVPPMPAAYVERPSVKAGAVKAGTKLVAKDGQVYVARGIDADERGLSDVEMYRRAAAAGMNTFLFGMPGTGKTRGLQAAFPDAIIVPISGDTEVADLVGSYQPAGPDSFVWVDGPLLVAMDKGLMIVLDEVGLMDPKVAAIVYPLMDGRRELMVTQNPMRGTVFAKDGFAIAGTTNPDAPGVRLSEALLSRFHLHVEVGTDYKVARDMGVNDRLVQAAEHLAKQLENDEIGWAPQMRELLVAKQHEEAFGLVFALRNLIASAPAMEREVVEIQLRERFGDLPGAARKVRALKVS